MATEVLNPPHHVKSDLKHSSTKNRKSGSKLIVQTNPSSLNITGSPSSVKFPKIGECAHFHYETVDYGNLFITILDEKTELFGLHNNLEVYYGVRVVCHGKSWVIHRNIQQFSTLDETLHECVYERRFSRLPLLQKLLDENSGTQVIQETLEKYVARLSQLPENISCAPVLHWLEMNNKGRYLVGGVGDDAAINIPAVAAGHVVRRYTAQNENELSLEVGDMVSVIDMSDANWWKGKCRLMVGSFPSQCIKRIADAKEAEEAVPKPQHLENTTNLSSPSKSNVTTSPTNKNKPIMKKHGKFMEFLRSFLDSRPSKSQLKKSGILKERVFGCDLGEYLHNFKHDIPPVLKDCTCFIEKYGMMDGIYRISGVSSNVQQLRHEYDSENSPDLENWRGEGGVCDPHSIAGLCKLYFRELPNPLLTYQLYDKFAEATQCEMTDRLLRFYDVIQQLPPPHYRTVKHLMLHLNFMAKNDNVTSMHCRNLAIVWAPNLLRSREIEAGIAAFTEARVQSVVTEFLISNADIIFSEKLQTHGIQSSRPKSMMILSAPKLISLEEAQARSKNRGKYVRSSSTSNTSDNTEFTEVVQRRRKTVDADRKRNNRRTAVSAILDKSCTTRIDEDQLHEVNNERRVHTRISVEQLSDRRRKSLDPHINTSSWKNKLLSSFTKKSYSRTKSTEEEVPNKIQIQRSWSDDSLLSSHSSTHNTANEAIDEFTGGDREIHPCLRPTAQSLRENVNRSPRPRGRLYNSLRNSKISDDNESSEAFLSSETLVDTTLGKNLGYDQVQSTVNSRPSENKEAIVHAQNHSPSQKEEINENNNNKGHLLVTALWNETKPIKPKDIQTDKKKPNQTTYWKNEDIEVPKFDKTSTANLPPNDFSNYSIHYTPNNQIRNGRTHRSFRATFVKDRQKLDRETPHTILRSYDVPPPVTNQKVADKLKLLHRQSLRSKTVSESEHGSVIQINATDNQSIMHPRSSSVSDELMCNPSPILPTAKPRHKPPVPKPRTNQKQSITGTNKPTVPVREIRKDYWQESSLISHTSNKPGPTSSNASRIIKHMNSTKPTSVNNNVLPNNEVISHTVLSWV